MGVVLTAFTIISHGQPIISELGQPFRSQFVLYWEIKQTLDRTSWCNKVDAVRL